jgi:starch synthase (maltosyl-transferring)
MDMPDLRAIEGRRRVAIENVNPVVDCGRFPIKRTIGQTVVVTADVLADGHDVIRAALLSRKQGETAWRETPMVELGNDRWQGQFDASELGRYEYTVVGWVNAFASWHRDLQKRIDAGHDVTVDLQVGTRLVSMAAERAAGDDAKRLRDWHAVLTAGSASSAMFREKRQELADLMDRYPDRRLASQYDPPLGLIVDPVKARFSAWYELFPRSCGAQAARHGTFSDVIDWLPRLAEMGFDILYLPPIHPIGTTFRKGKNNAVAAEAGDLGSPWAIGSSEGDHTAIHQQLGTLADLSKLVAAAKDRGIDIALDVAFQCSPDHPYVKQHPQWFRKRPDGTIQYAENPPKKYQDIYPFDFETSDWRALWRELTDVVLYWCAQNIRIFRVDNPHTKPFAFWEFLIAEVKAQFPDAIFLSEAFTRPKIMYRLAKLGFTQSYTYFTWRNSKAELIEYFTEITQPPLCEYFRPNLWPNTPDILPEHLQTGGRAAFVARLVLAATLGANYGIYGPAYETLENRPREPGSEEYLNSEKFELRNWDFDRPDNLRVLITAVNRARRENSALQSDAGLRFHTTDNDQLLCYSKHGGQGFNVVLVVVNLNFHELQRGFINVPLGELGIRPDRPYQVEDLLAGTTFTWQGPRNFVELDPHQSPAHIFRVVPQA